MLYSTGPLSFHMHTKGILTRHIVSGRGPEVPVYKARRIIRLSMMSKGDSDIGDGSGEGPVDMGNKATSFCDIIFFFFFHLLLPINLSSLRLQFFFFLSPQDLGGRDMFCVIFD